jgi:hypothetical protein
LLKVALNTITLTHNWLRGNTLEYYKKTLSKSIQSKRNALKIWWKIMFKFWKLVFFGPFNCAYLEHYREYLMTYYQKLSTCIALWRYTEVSDITITNPW